MSKTKKILILTPTLQGGGAERVASVLAEILNANCEFSVSVAVYDSSKIAYDVTSDLIDINEPSEKPIVKKFFTTIRRIWKLRSVIKTGEYNVVISFMEAANFVNIINKYIFKQNYKLIVTVHNNILAFPSYYLFAMKLLYRFSDVIIAVSKGVRDDLASLNKGVFEKTRVIYNPVSSSFFDVTPKRNEQCTNNTRNIIAVGSLTHQKGFDLLIAAIANMHNKDKIQLSIFGEGKDEAVLNQTIQYHGLSDRVSLKGFCQNIHREYCKSDIFILSSRYEGFGNVLVEAMAAGCYPISFDVKHGPSEILEGAIGGLVPAGNITALSDAIDNVCAPEFVIDDEMRQKIRQRAYDFHVDNFKKSWLKIL